MRGIRFAFCALAVLTSLTLLNPTPAFPVIGTSGNTAGGVDLLGPYTDPSASGAKLSGTLAIYFVFDYQGTCGVVPGNLYFLVYTMRVIKGSTILPFSGSSATSFCLTDTAGIVGEINNFVNGKVIQKVYPTLPQNPNPQATLKSVTNELSPSPPASGEGPCCDDASGEPMLWVILDIEYAVK